MIVGNLYHIKATNGLYYYGIDYLQQIQKSVRKVLVRPTLLSAAKRALPSVEILACNAGQLLVEAARATSRQDFIYTPTPHPLPFVSSQLIIIHDAYPFVGRKGKLKLQLLKASLATSKCMVGYINESDTLPFVTNLGVDPQRLLFAPNKFPPKQTTERNRHPSEHGLVIGLVGSDSRKKNYEALFGQVMKAQAEQRLQFRVYGHDSAYLRELKSQFPHVMVELVESDAQSLPDFFSGIDMLASVADQEGFGRPIAAALLSQIPCFLLNRAVFKEFFEPGAQFFPNEVELVHALIREAGHKPIQKPDYEPPAKVTQAYEKAIAQLHARAVETACTAAR